MLISTFTDKIILVVGGDLRQITVAKCFSKSNTVFCVGLEQSPELTCAHTTIEQLLLLSTTPDYIILPMPASLDQVNVNTPFSSKVLSLEDVLSVCGENTLILGGKLPASLISRASSKGISCIDYLEREELAILNAVPTAEGALQIAMEELATTIYKTDCLIVGYGRIGKVLARYLRALGANVTVSARKFRDLALIDTDGYTSVHISDLKTAIRGKHVVFNTVPVTILQEEILKAADESCLMIDLASKPGGIDMQTANSLGLRTIWALSLPGKVAPITAGKIIYDTIQNIEQERSDTLEQD